MVNESLSRSRAQERREVRRANAAQDFVRSAESAKKTRVWHMVLVPSVGDDEGGVMVFCISENEAIAQREFDRQRERYPEGLVEKVKAIEAE